MKITSVTMRNFMPFKGTHRIALPSDDAHSVTVVFGDNMRGKTSFLNAIRWCLYGRALGRHLSEIDLARMVNHDAAAAGDFELSVFLTFRYDDDEYDLRRTARLREMVSVPRNGGDFRIETTLRKNGSVLRADEIEDVINQIAPEQISRFFLFDGELLQEYETLLSDSSEQGEKIKTAIEQVLGVPALLEGREQMRVLHRRAQAAQAKDHRHIKSLKGLAEEQLSLQAKIEARSNDLEALQERHSATQHEVDTLDDYLAATEAVQRVRAALDKLDERNGQLTQRERDLQADKLTCLRDAWRDLLQPRLRVRMETLRRASDDYTHSLERAGAVKEQIRQLETILSSGSCEVCGEDMNQSRREALGRRLGKLQADLATLVSDGKEFQTIAEELNRLSRITATSAADRLRTIEGQLDRVALDLTSVETEMTRLEDQIQGEDTAEIARKRELRDGLQKTLGRIESDILATRLQIDKDSTRQNEISRTMSKSAESRLRKTTRQVEVYSDLEKVFSDAVEALRDDLRAQVADQASRTFLRLTTEKTYRGLTINDNYGLSIIDRHGRTVSVRSAGAEQVVALALIDGLNRTAGKRGPIIMDTPLGRLDPKHRASVLAEVPHMADQVVLLVHEGEITKESGLEPLASRIGRVYEIERISSSQSRFRDARTEVVS